MKIQILNFLLGAMSAILLLFAINYFTGFGIIESPTSVKVINSIASPNGEFLATTNRASNKNIILITIILNRYKSNSSP